MTRFMVDLQNHGLSRRRAPAAQHVDRYLSYGETVLPP